MRQVIEIGINNQCSAGEIARKLGISTSTVTREVKNNRTDYFRENKHWNKSLRCQYFDNCTQKGNACRCCKSPYTYCKKCTSCNCYDSCKNFKLKYCSKCSKWPYVCRGDCPEKGRCPLPRPYYKAYEAQEHYFNRLVSSREGIDSNWEDIQKLKELVEPLIKKGQSFTAIARNHKDEISITERSLYNYYDKGVFSLNRLDMPISYRYKPRKRRIPIYKDHRINREGREYKDFLLLPEEDQAKTVQCDTVVGQIDNSQVILSMHFKSYVFQFYFLLDRKTPSQVVAVFNMLEKLLGSVDAFNNLFGILLVDRGVEFDWYDKMEQSCLDANRRRCKVFYCDAMNSNQKAECERNHRELRRVLPKKKNINFDMLTKAQVSLICSNVNSYPRPSLHNAAPIDLIDTILPNDFLDELKIHKIDRDDVVLKPSLIAIR